MAIKGSSRFATKRKVYNTAITTDSEELEEFPEKDGEEASKYSSGERTTSSSVSLSEAVLERIELDLRLSLENIARVYSSLNKLPREFTEDSEGGRSRSDFKHRIFDQAQAAIRPSPDDDEDDASSAEADEDSSANGQESEGNTEVDVDSLDANFTAQKPQDPVTEMIDSYTDYVKSHRHGFENMMVHPFDKASLGSVIGFAMRAAQELLYICPLPNAEKDRIVDDLTKACMEYTQKRHKDFSTYGVV